MNKVNIKYDSIYDEFVIPGKGLNDSYHTSDRTDAIITTRCMYPEVTIITCNYKKVWEK